MTKDEQHISNLIKELNFDSIVLCAQRGEEEIVFLHGPSMVLTFLAMASINRIAELTKEEGEAPSANA